MPIVNFMHALIVETAVGTLYRFATRLDTSVVTKTNVIQCYVVEL